MPNIPEKKLKDFSVAEIQKHLHAQKTSTLAKLDTKEREHLDAFAGAVKAHLNALAMAPKAQQKAKDLLASKAMEKISDDDVTVYLVMHGLVDVDLSEYR